MTPYQRGSRDSLRALAVELDADAERSAETVAYWNEAADRARLQGRIDHYRRMAIQHTHVRDAYVRAASLARRRAGALPDDPEDEP